MRSPASASVLRCLAIGVGAGAAYGVLLRLWMRLISTEPGFTWTGTGYIVAAFTIVGALAGLATAGRRRGWRWSLVALRAVAVVLSLGCFVAAGSAMFPTIVPGALGRARTDWPRWLRALLLAFAAVTAVWISLSVTLTDLPAGRKVLGLLLYLAFCCVEVELFARFYAPSLPAGTFRRSRRAGTPATVASAA